MALTTEQIARYRRSLLLPEIGERGQRRLARSRVLLVGAGGLGSAAALYLVATGVGRLGVADGDRVELSNLQRQVLYRTTDVGRPKAEAARRALLALNPECEVVAHPVRVEPGNARELVAGYEVVVDAVDNLAARYAVNDACVAAGKPLVEAAVRGTGGHLTVFPAGGRPCYRCLFPAPPDRRARGGREAVPEAPEEPDGPPGVLNTAAGLLGMLEATEALKLLLGTGSTLVGQLLCVDLWVNDFRLLPVAAAPGCPVCGRGRDLSGRGDGPTGPCAG